MRTPVSRTVFLLACAAIVVSLVAPAARAAASDGARKAADFGCANCHKQERGFAPSLQELADHSQQHGDTPEALQSMLREVREHGMIHTHRMVSDESLLAILKWLAQGAK